MNYELSRSVIEARDSTIGVIALTLIVGDRWEIILMATWRCIKQCGACCNLDPSDRPDLEEYLPPEQLAVYLSMVGLDGLNIIVF